ncbi:hypothetical protein RB597_006433 [Gaeumannomyces tritici]
MVSPQNRGAFLVAAKARPLAVREAPYSPPGPGEVVVKNAAIALNPIDYAKQSVGNFLYSHIKYPFITGTDVAGVVVEVGPDATRPRARHGEEAQQVAHVWLPAIHGPAHQNGQSRPGIHPARSKGQERDAIQLATAAGYQVVTTGSRPSSCGARRWRITRSAS